MAFLFALPMFDYDFFLDDLGLAGALAGLVAVVFSVAAVLDVLAGLSPRVEISETSTGGSLGLSPRSLLST